MAKKKKKGKTKELLLLGALGVGAFMLLGGVSARQGTSSGVGSGGFLLGPAPLGAPSGNGGETTPFQFILPSSQEDVGYENWLDQFLNQDTKKDLQNNKIAELISWSGKENGFDQDITSENFRPLNLGSAIKEAGVTYLTNLNEWMRAPFGKKLGRETSPPMESPTKKTKASAKPTEVIQKGLDVSAGAVYSKKAVYSGGGRAPVKTLVVKTGIAKGLRVSQGFFERLKRGGQL